MYIERIILSGFKSYRDHTVVDGFDPYFNAITGLNGSGKSNVLDAICFVLGMSNISNLRAEGLQGLIYKSGQSGISKASVEIIFNNEDKSASPVGYQEFDKITVMRQVTAGSSSKYFINDHPANQTRVQNLFHSVQLNVNNPHFLIQQGSIEKIVKMKPPEILKLIEEAAGISMFQVKKEDAVRTLEKKQHQLDEITRIIETELIPNLEKLRKDKDEYNKWATSKTEIDRLSRWLIAKKFTDCETAINEGDAAVVKARQEADEAKAAEEQSAAELAEIRQKIKDLQNSRDGETKKKINELNKRAEEIQEKIDSATMKKTHDLEELKRINSKVKKLTDQLKEQKDELTKRQEESTKTTEDHQKLENEEQEALEKVQQLEKRITEVNIGIANENDNKSLSDIIENEKKKLADIDVNLMRISNSQPHLERQLMSLQSQLKSSEREKVELENKRDKVSFDLENINEQLRNLNFDPNRERNLLQERDQLSHKLQQLSDELDNLERNIIGVNIDFANKPHDLNEEGIYGVVARLMKMKDGKYSLAAEQAAGGRLYYIVTDNKETATQLIKPGVLQRRSTTIPLREIRYKNPDAEKVRKAQRIDPSAHPLVDEVEYKKLFEPAIRYVFSDTLVVDTLQGAREVTFDKNIMMKSVTLEGDIVDPAGTLTGGSRPQNSGIIEKISLFTQKVNEEKDIKEKLRQINDELRTLENDSRKYRDLMHQKDIMEYELNIANTAIANSRSAEYQRQYDEIQNELKQNSEDEVKLRSQKGDIRKEIDRLSSELEAWQSEKTSRVASLEKQLSEARKLHEEKTKIRFSSDNEIARVTVLVQELNNQIKQSEQQLDDFKHAAEQKEKSADENQKILEKSNQEKSDNENELKKLDETMRLTSKSLDELRKSEDATAVKLQKETQKRKKLESQIESHSRIKSELKQKIESLIKDNKWIEQEKRFFGVSHTDFDFELYEKKEAKSKLKKMIEEQKELETRVNKRVMSQYERAEHELNKLTEKKQIVEEEKVKILDVIKELEQKKEEALTTALKKVNGDLSDIVSHLLYGATATLEDENDHGVRGFDFIVRLNGLQKGLQELSGGQRALIALGLVLALLKFNPAPIYILDEVDAALDLSRTQDIGRLLKSQFKASQFIVVSHKEGLYKYANVLFRTSFNGTTQITRTVQHHD
ncbi:SMC flexible hinge domain protein, putative [Trichomonas vaginalis G3]|uniref:SMC flexible hinge domain protein, putative n=1 Tax=Trichomonas vaginalis (strain ATCC PRA-98 / G3) TaxID=412133 RepID=A2EKI4_TRIV3|nr:structural maintenance of chromosomes protein 2 family [Trichomonas vaginalis G3]EAY06811.1 SMC flexible hinge domain protein, putative [Trichomonas vaginalis G3]KAI5535422.1 structural maintenance of chromosomes protein 2 family [Trichomonas vaginalis G3]|eukprot:XP_001319034.1 SMC flexible hinge domain protein [Trichomonas vaginalis G3]